MPRLLPFLFLALPFAEIATFIVVGRAIGLWATLGLIILSMVLGLMIVKSQGLAHLGRLRSNLQNRNFRAAQPMMADMLHSLLLAVAGILFLIPGFLTDILAVLLLLPPVRSLLGYWMLKNMTVITTTVRSSDPNGDIIEGEFTERPGDSQSGTPPVLPLRE